MADLSQLRSEIDRIDTQLFELFSQRVDVARRIGDYKRERGLAVFDPTRERLPVVEAVCALAVADSLLAWPAEPLR